jgi:hypothetical protein
MIATGPIMQRLVKRSALALAAIVLTVLGAGGQDRGGDVKLPNGKSQREEILKADHRKNLQDAAALVDLTEQLKQELEKNDRYVLSVSSLKKTEEIEKLAKQIRSRLRRF